MRWSATSARASNAGFCGGGLHTWKATRQDTGGAFLLCLQTPGSGEEFYRIASEPAVEGDPATPIDFDRV